MKFSLFLRGAVTAGLWMAVGAGAPARGDERTPGLARATVLIIRHAEEPGHGSGLSAVGQAHANACVSYFENYRVNANTLFQASALFAAADSKKSERPRLTLTPLGQSLGLPINSQYSDKDYAKLADVLESSGHGRFILVCWHHGEIPNLVRALGGDPRELLPDGQWPGEQYGWVVQLRYDKQGVLKSEKLVVEGL